MRLEEHQRPQKGRLFSYNPVTREKTFEFSFMFNPSEIKVTFSPQFSYNTAATGSRAYAQYGNSEPLEISFTLFLFEQEKNNAVTLNLSYLRSLVEPVPNEADESLYRAPPIVYVDMGETFNWLDRSLYGVIDSLEVAVKRQNPDLSPQLAECEITFKEIRTTLGDSQ